MKGRGGVLRGNKPFKDCKKIILLSSTTRLENNIRQEVCDSNKQPGPKLQIKQVLSKMRNYQVQKTKLISTQLAVLEWDARQC